jgi:hypothetical protein
MELLDDVGDVESSFGLLRDSANKETRYVHVLHWKYYTLRNHFGRTQYNF